MKTAWDYTDLADAYLKRPDYSDAAIDSMLSHAKISKGASVCDVGAGVAHLTLALQKRGLKVSAVEPNDAMRQNGISRCSQMKGISWFEGTGEDTKLAAGAFDLVTFGSSFNVVEQSQALKESARILKSKGWFACMWNHRELNDPIQQATEAIIASEIPEYAYGNRRAEQTETIRNSQLFCEPLKIDGHITHSQKVVDCVEAWRSHATLQRQAKDKFSIIVGKIERYLLGLNVESITIPYTTRIWLAQKSK